MIEVRAPEVEYCCAPSLMFLLVIGKIRFLLFTTLKSLFTSFFIILFILVANSSAKTELISIANDGSYANKYSGAWSLSFDGRYVLFNSDANNLVAGDTNNAMDVFVRDRKLGITTRVSVASDGSETNNSSVSGRISTDGRYVVFTSSANNLVVEDTDSFYDVYLHDRSTGNTRLVSVASDGTKSTGNSYAATMSDDGRYIAFVSTACNLVPDTCGVGIYRHDTVSGETRLVVQNSGSDGYAMSGDGRSMAFVNRISMTTGNRLRFISQIFVHDIETGLTSMISKSTDGSPGNFNSISPAFSADGRYVSFFSSADNLVPGDTNFVGDIFVHDRVTAQTIRVSVASDGSEANMGAFSPFMSGDGRYILFRSASTNLGAGLNYAVEQFYMHDRILGKTFLVSTSFDGIPVVFTMYGTPLSGDGKVISFGANAGNGLEGNPNYGNVYVHIREPKISITSSTVKFENVVLNKNSRTQQITIYNTGTGDLNISTLFLSGDASGEFVLSNDACSGKIIAPFLSCTADLSFSPSSAGLKSADLSILSDDPDQSNIAVHLYGSGVVQSSPTSLPDISLLSWEKTVISNKARDYAIAIDSKGSPHISFMDESNGSNFVLKHSYFNGSAWMTETVDSGNVGRYSSIAVDSKDHLHISYLDGDYLPYLKYAFFDGIKWHIEIVESGGFSSSIAVDDNNLPHIAHIDNSNLKYLSYDGSAWHSETIDGDALYFGMTSLVIAPSGNPHISYSTHTLPRGLFYATPWLETFESYQAGSGIQSSLAIDSSESPHIVYFSETEDRGLKYAIFDGIEWFVQNFSCELQTGACGDSASIVIDKHDNVHMAINYSKPVSNGYLGFLIYGRYDLNGWRYSQVDTLYSYHPVFAIDNFGFPHMLYSRPNNKGSNTLVYASIAVPDLVGELLTYSFVTKKGKKSVNGQLKITNSGTKSVNKTNLVFYLSDDDSFGPGDLSIGKAVKVTTLLPGQSKQISFSIPYTSSMAGKKLLAVIDASKSVSELSELNNVIVIGTLQ